MGLFAGRMACGAFYAASETLARPGHPQGTVLAFNYPTSNINYPLSTLYLALSYWL